MIGGIKMKIKKLLCRLFKKRYIDLSVIQQLQKRGIGFY